MEIVSAVDEAGDKVPGGLQEVQVLAAQRAQFGGLGLYIEANDAFFLGADGLQYRVMDGDDIRLVIPDSLRQQVLKFVHGSRTVGHWCSRLGDEAVGRVRVWCTDEVRRSPARERGCQSRVFGMDARVVLLMVGTQVDDDQLNTVSCGGGKPMLEAGKKTPLKSCDY
jgi:hypothetical protein